MKLLSNAREVKELLSVRGPSSPAEIAEQLGTPRSSVYRLVEGLAAVDLVSIGADGQAELHLKWLHLADAARSAMSEWSSAGGGVGGVGGGDGGAGVLRVAGGRGGGLG